MSDVKIQVSLDLISQIEDKLSELFHSIEEDENVPEKSFRTSETYIDSLFMLLRELKTELYYS